MPRPHSISNILSELMARRGYARVQSAEVLGAAWGKVCGPLASHTRVGALRGGRLDVVVSSSTLSQELTYQKADLLAQLSREVPEAKIADLRFRVGKVGK